MSKIQLLELRLLGQMKLTKLTIWLKGGGKDFSWVWFRFCIPPIRRSKYVGTFKKYKFWLLSPIGALHARGTAWNSLRFFIDIKNTTLILSGNVLKFWEFSRFSQFVKLWLTAQNNIFGSSKKSEKIRGASYRAV